MAYLSAVRDIITMERTASIGPVDAYISEMDNLMKQLEPIIKW